MAKNQVEFLRNLRRSSAAAKAIFQILATRQRHREACLVSRTADQAGVSEEEVKEFFRALQDGGFGRYVKRSRGGQARFVWGTTYKGEYDLNYSLIAVGRVAEGHDEPLDGYLDNPVEGVEDDEESDDELGSESYAVEPELMTIRTYFRGAKVRIDLPVDFDPATEADELRDLIVMMVKHQKKRGG